MHLIEVSLRHPIVRGTLSRDSSVIIFLLRLAGGDWVTSPGLLPPESHGEGILMAPDPEPAALAPSSSIEDMSLSLSLPLIWPLSRLLVRPMVRIKKAKLVAAVLAVEVTGRRLALLLLSLLLPSLCLLVSITLTVLGGLEVPAVLLVVLPVGDNRMVVSSLPSWLLEVTTWCCLTCLLLPVEDLESPSSFCGSEETVEAMSAEVGRIETIGLASLLPSVDSVLVRPLLMLRVLTGDLDLSRPEVVILRPAARERVGASERTLAPPLVEEEVDVEAPLRLVGTEVMVTVEDVEVQVFVAVREDTERIVAAVLLLLLSLLLLRERGGVGVMVMEVEEE